jgi:MFS superfamily sulfate permease-like transporter
VNQIAAMMRHDRMAVLGFALIGVSAILSIRLHRKLLDVGVDTSALFIRIPNNAVWTVPRAYLKACSKHDWSTWPAYALWLTAFSGVVLLVAGIFRLAD